VQDGHLSSQKAYIAHSAVVKSLAWSPSGTHIASGSRDGKLRIIAASAAEIQREIVVVPESLEHPWIQSVAWSPDGLNVAVGAVNGLTIVHAETGHISRGGAHGGHLESISWSKGGRQVATASLSGEVRVVDVTKYGKESGAVTNRIEMNHNVHSLEWNNTEDRLAVAAGHGGLHVLNIPSASLAFKWSDGQIQHVAWHPSYKYLAACSSNLLLIDALSGLLLKQFTLPGCHLSLTGLAWNGAGGRLAVAAYGGALFIVHAESGTVEYKDHKVAQQDGTLYTVGWNPVEDEVAIGGRNNAVIILDLTGAEQEERRTPTSNMRWNSTGLPL